MGIQHVVRASLLVLLGLMVPDARAADPGHCRYVQQNLFAGPFRVCEMPMTAARCEALGRTDQNRDAMHAAGACPRQALVGTCDKGATQLLYYEGDPAELDIGCGFQGGTWLKP